MKQVVQNYRSGTLEVLDAPEPACKDGGVLVATEYSLISAGTELMKVAEAKLSLLGMARRRPDQVRKLVDSVTQVGAVATYEKAMARLDSYTPLGYSLCGTVLAVGGGVDGCKVGDRVACAGNEHALHAEVNWVPTNLTVRVPEGVDPRHAAFSTVGAIAMHGVRRAEVSLGETACVIGLGLIGQLVVQLLAAAGVRVVGIDPVVARQELARSNGALECGAPTGRDLDRLEHALAAMTQGRGADHVLLAAGGATSDPVHLAARFARDRARVVDIGKCQLDLPWNEYYEKELDVRFSRSYGPGRYDDTYELDGVDYPAGYVRWTERRNLECFLDLLQRKEVDVEPLVSGVFPIDDAVDVYGRLDDGSLRGIGFLFRYPERQVAVAAPITTSADGAALNGRRQPAARPPRPRPAPSGAVGVGFIGAGGYASSMLLPHLVRDESVELVRVATTTSLSAANAQRRFGFADAATDVDAVLDDERVDAVFIVTRHRSHADLACRALERGKAVFVEKPMALSIADADRISATVERTGNDRLMVGFNRRFAPLLVALRERFPEAGPTVLRYLVNAGPLDRRSWYRDPAEGSRFEGEGGHFLDTAAWWVGSRPVEVHAAGAGDDVVATVRFEDGSLAQVSYLTGGSPRHPKEIFEAWGAGATARLDNFRRATVWQGRRRRSQRAFGGVDKGQRIELRAFVRAVADDGPMPIPLASSLATTRATLAVSTSLASGRPVAV